MVVKDTILAYTTHIDQSCYNKGHTFLQYVAHTFLKCRD